MKRIQIFAGPNGSGKSTLVRQFIESDPWLINTQLHIYPDKLNLTKVIDFGNYGIQTDISEFKEHLLNSTLFPISNIDIDGIKFKNNCFIDYINNFHLKWSNCAFNLHY